MQEAMFYGDMSFVAASVMSSEGEKIALNMQKAAAKISGFCLTGLTADSALTQLRI